MTRAMRLKKAFSRKWRFGVRRELLVYNIVNMYLPRDFIALLTGIGSGVAEYIEESYSNPLNAFDITVFDYELKPVAFLEITGIRSTSDYDRGKGLCIGSWKVWKAEKFGVQDKTWYIHVLDDRISLRFIPYHTLKKYAVFHTLNEGYGVKGEFYCCDQSRWGSIKDFLRWLSTRVVR